MKIVDTLMLLWAPFLLFPIYAQQTIPTNPTVPPLTNGLMRISFNVSFISGLFKFLLKQP